MNMKSSAAAAPSADGATVLIGKYLDRSHRKIARIVAIAAAMAPALWGPTATAQTIQPIVKLVPDLVVTRVALNCNGVAVTVRNDGSAMLRITSPIVVRMSALVGVEGGVMTLDKALAATSLSSGQTETVKFLIGGAPGFIEVTATADATKVITESNETNNERKAMDEQTCPILRVTNASVGEGGDLVFTATLDRRPVNNASFSWKTSALTATGGTACGGLVDFVAASGTTSFSSLQAVPTPRTVSIKTCRDLASEPAETLRLALSSFNNLFLVPFSPAPLGTIANEAPLLAK